MAHLSIGMWVRRLIGIAPGAYLSCGRSCRQSPRGASRSKGLVVRKHVPDRARQLARHDDRRDLRTALGAVALAGALIELAVVRERPACWVASISAQRRYRGPFFFIGPRQSCSPDRLTLGHNPV